MTTMSSARPGKLPSLAHGRTGLCRVGQKPARSLRNLLVVDRGDDSHSRYLDLAAGAAHLADTCRWRGADEPFADPNPFLTLVSQLIGQVIMLPAVASVAVAWHRLLLRGERPGTGHYLRFDRVVIGYAILAFWIGLITLMPRYISLVFQIVTGTSTDERDPATMRCKFSLASC